MTRYVLAFLAFKLAFVIGLGAIFSWIDGEVPNLSTPAGIVCVALSISWYARRENRPLSARQILFYSIGTVLAELFLSVTLAVTMLWIASAPLSWEGLDAATFGGGGNIETTKKAVLIGVIVGSIQTFALSMAFAWLFTRKLPKSKTVVD